MLERTRASELEFADKLAQAEESVRRVSAELAKAKQQAGQAEATVKAR